MARERKIALITGASGGIGFASVEVFAAQGWRVLAVDLNQPQGPFPGNTEFFPADLSVPGEIHALCDRLSAELPNGLDALVNNAAHQMTKSLIETSAEEWDHTQAVNLRAPFLLTKSFYPLLKQARGSVVNVASVHALASSAGIGAYAASKSGLLALTRAMAIEFSGDGLRVNAVLPGATDTAMLEAGLEREHIKGGSKQARKSDLSRKILLKRLAVPEEIARAIYFLADSEQSAYITGQSLVVDGGALAQLSTE